MLEAGRSALRQRQTNEGYFEVADVRRFKTSYLHQGHGRHAPFQIHMARKYGSRKNSPAAGLHLVQRLFLSTKSEVLANRNQENANTPVVPRLSIRVLKVVACLKITGAHSQRSGVFPDALHDANNEPLGIATKASGLQRTGKQASERSECQITATKQHFKSQGSMHYMFWVTTTYSSR